MNYVKYLSYSLIWFIIFCNPIDTEAASSSYKNKLINKYKNLKEAIRKKIYESIVNNRLSKQHPVHKSLPKTHSDKGDYENDESEENGINDNYKQNKGNFVKGSRRNLNMHQSAKFHKKTARKKKLKRGKGRRKKSNVPQLSKSQRKTAHKKKRKERKGRGKNLNVPQSAKSYKKTAHERKLREGKGWQQNLKMHQLAESHKRTAYKRALENRNDDGIWMKWGRWSKCYKYHNNEYKDRKRSCDLREKRCPKRRKKFKLFKQTIRCNTTPPEDYEEEAQIPKLAVGCYLQGNCANNKRDYSQRTYDDYGCKNKNACSDKTACMERVEHIHTFCENTLEQKFKSIFVDTTGVETMYSFPKENEADTSEEV